jgi:LysM repeat protein
MDTISRESSPSYLPIAGLIAGLVGLLLGGIALANASKAGKAALAADEKAVALTSRIDGVEASVSEARSAADRTASNIASLQRSTQDAFTAVAGEIGKVNGEIAKLQESASKPSKAGTAKAGAAVAGPDEYLIVGGDTGAKIARAKGVALSDLITVNPGVNWTALKVGQKIKLPAKK